VVVIKDVTPEGYLIRLLEASNKKYKLLQDMLVLTTAQTQSITEESMKTLENLVEEKQAKIEEINKVDEEFNVYFHRFKQVLNIKSLDELQTSGIAGTKELKESVGKTINLLNEIFQMEKQNNNKAKCLLDNFSDELHKLQQGKKVNSVYNPAPMQTSSYFIDKKK